MPTLSALTSGASLGRHPHAGSPSQCAPALAAVLRDAPPPCQHRLLRRRAMSLARHCARMEAPQWLLPRGTYAVAWLNVSLISQKALAQLACNAWRNTWKP